MFGIACCISVLLLQCVQQVCYTSVLLLFQCVLPGAVCVNKCVVVVAVCCQVQQVLHKCVVVVSMCSARCRRCYTSVLSLLLQCVLPGAAGVTQVCCCCSSVFCQVQQVLHNCVVVAVCSARCSRCYTSVLCCCCSVFCHVQQVLHKCVVLLLQCVLPCATGVTQVCCVVVPVCSAMCNRCYTSVLCCCSSVFCHVQQVLHKCVVLLFQCVLPGATGVWPPVGEPAPVLRARGLLEGLPSVGSNGQHPGPAGRPRLLPGHHWPDGRTAQGQSGVTASGLRCILSGEVQWQSG